MKRFVCLLVLVCCAVFFASAVAQAADKSDGCPLTKDNNREVMLEKYLDGERAFNAEQYSKAFAILKPVAEAGNPNAQYLLGLMNDFGYGVKVDHVKANEWYLKAAQQGQDDAQFNLGISYLTGEGIGKDMLMAVCWVAKAAANGDEDALGTLIKLGEQKVPEAQYALYLIYKNGVKLHKNPELYPHESDNKEIKPDNDKAQMWLKQAKANGYK